MAITRAEFHRLLKEISAKIDSVRGPSVSIRRSDKIELTTTNSLLSDIISVLNTLNLNTDGIETILSLIDGNTDGIEALLSTIEANTDGIEALLSAIDSNTDGIEAKLDTLETTLTAIEDDADFVRSTLDFPFGVLALLFFSMEATLLLINSNVNSLESDLDGLTGKIDTLNTTATAIDTVLDVIADRMRNDLQQAQNHYRYHATWTCTAAGTFDLEFLTTDNRMFVPEVIRLVITDTGSLDYHVRKRRGANIADFYTEYIGGNTSGSSPTSEQFRNAQSDILHENQTLRFFVDDMAIDDTVLVAWNATSRLSAPIPTKTNRSAGTFTESVQEETIRAV